MTTDKVTISDAYDLLALHRALMEARYCDVPNDPDVSGSPRLAEIHKKVIAAIYSANLPGGLSPDSWNDWLAIDDSRREWRVALARAANSPRWRNLDEEGKLSLASSLLSPFSINHEVLTKFVKSVDTKSS